MIKLPPPPTRSNENEFIWKAWFNTLYSYVISFQIRSGIPTATDIPQGRWGIFKDTAGGTLKIYANDGGTIKSVTLT